jgi:hypothetical protein
VLSATLTLISLTFSALTLASLLALAQSFSPVWSFFRAVVALKVTFAAASRSALYPYFSMNWKKDMRCFMYSSPSALLPRRVCLDSPSGILTLIVSREVLTGKPFLDTAYRMGGHWVTCPFSQSASLNSWDVGVELILNSRYWQSGVISIKCLNTFFTGCSRIRLVGQAKFAESKIFLIPLSQIGGNKKNTMAFGVAWG